MKVLVIGGGGREHALAWRLAQSESVCQVICSPGNPGIAEIGQCFPGLITSEDYVRLAKEQAVDLTVVGPEAPLMDGVVDSFRAQELKIVGPTRAAAKLEGSKTFAKQFMQAAAIPTARSIETYSFEEAADALSSFGYPMVIKADGLAAGKGVIIAQDRDEALGAIKRLGPLLVLEEFLEGEEISFIGLCHDAQVLPFAPAQDHKRVYDGDTGPNTGGMGAVCDTRLLKGGQQSDIVERIMLPALHRMQAIGTSYSGFLYAGLMMTSDGPKVLEFNVRLGDPETQAMLVGLAGDFGDTLRASLSGGMSRTNLSWPFPSICVVMAAANYPEKPRSGDAITGISDAQAQNGVQVFQAGTQKAGQQIITAGGRVLGVTALGATLPDAAESAYTAVRKIEFTGAHYRRDIGQKALRRW